MASPGSTSFKKISSWTSETSIRAAHDFDQDRNLLIFSNYNQVLFGYLDSITSSKNPIYQTSGFVSGSSNILELAIVKGPSTRLYLMGDKYFEVVIIKETAQNHLLFSLSLKVQLPEGRRTSFFKSSNPGQDFVFLGFNNKVGRLDTTLSLNEGSRMSFTRELGQNFQAFYFAELSDNLVFGGNHPSLFQVPFSDLSSVQTLSLKEPDRKKETRGLAVEGIRKNSAAIFQLQSINSKKSLRLSRYSGLTSFELTHYFEDFSRWESSAVELRLSTDFNILIAFVGQGIKFFASDNLELLEMNSSMLVSPILPFSISKQFIQESSGKFSAVFTYGFSVQKSSSQVIELYTGTSNVPIPRRLDELPPETPSSVVPIDIASKFFSVQAKEVSINFASKLQKRVPLDALEILLIDEVAQTETQCSKACSIHITGSAIKVKINHSQTILKGSIRINLKPGSNTPIFSEEEDKFFINYPIEVGISRYLGSDAWIFECSSVIATVGSYSFSAFRSVILPILYLSTDLRTYLIDLVIADLTFLRLALANELAYPTIILQIISDTGILPGMSETSDPFTDTQKDGAYSPQENSKFALRKLQSNFFCFLILFTLAAILTGVHHYLMPRLSKCSNSKIAREAIEWLTHRFGFRYLLNKFLACNLEILTLSFTVFTKEEGRTWQGLAMASIFVLVTVLQAGAIVKDCIRAERLSKLMLSSDAKGSATEIKPVLILNRRRRERKINLSCLPSEATSTRIERLETEYPKLSQRAPKSSVDSTEVISNSLDEANKPTKNLILAYSEVHSQARSVLLSLMACSIASDSSRALVLLILQGFSTTLDLIFVVKGRSLTQALVSINHLILLVILAFDGVLLTVTPGKYAAAAGMTLTICILIAASLVFFTSAVTAKLVVHVCMLSDPSRVEYPKITVKDPSLRFLIKEIGDANIPEFDEPNHNPKKNKVKSLRPVPEMDKVHPAFKKYLKSADSKAPLPILTEVSKSKTPYSAVSTAFPSNESLIPLNQLENHRPTSRFNKTAKPPLFGLLSPHVMPDS